ncbi:MAG: lipoyl synthase [Gammaproteobacteria bacterium]|nr:MAG: lipoyl synthase [Gammaproteobacteria bacterium]
MTAKNSNTSQSKSHVAKLGVKQRGHEKVTKIPISFKSLDEITRKRIPKPKWLHVKAPTSAKVRELKSLLREQKLNTVCEEASCPNLTECFDGGTATFMIMGDVCTRRCSFCDVAHGRPLPLDVNEPVKLAETVLKLGLRYVVVTSVDRDDLKDGGASHFVDCIREIRQQSSEVKIEILVPDFRGRMDKALDVLSKASADVFNHNLETVPRLYPAARPGADYLHSLQLLQKHKQRIKHVPTKSGLMLGLGEEINEVIEVMKDLRAHDVDMLTLGQYLQPSAHHLAMHRYLDPKEFEALKNIGNELGFEHVASGPLVRSSYHADLQAQQALSYS